MQAIESVLYYRGRVCGICAVFSAISKVAGVEVKTIFTSSDLPDYHVYSAHKCPICDAGIRYTYIYYSFGYAKL